MREYLPNVLSVSRVVLAILVLLLSGRLTEITYLLTVSMATLAMITDALDGYLARRWESTSALGYVLDAMGDRAIHLSLMLVFLVRYEFNPIIVWLLVFRDVGIYAVRVLSKDWLSKSRKLRWISIFHATSLRVWLGLFIVRDGFRVFGHAGVLDERAFEAIQWTILCITIPVSYYGLLRSFSWLIDHDHSIV